jgi:ribosomal protein S14
MDNYKRKIYLRNELKRLLLRSIKRNTCSDHLKRYHAAYQLSHLPRFSARSIAVNRCVVSGRAFGVRNDTQYSRFVFRREVSHSNIPGCRRASW